MNRTIAARVAGASTMIIAAAASSLTFAPHASASSHGLDTKGTVTGKTLSVRTAPSTHAGTSGAALKHGAKITIDCNLNGTSVSGNDVWYKLANRPAWVSAKYVKVTGTEAVACTAASDPSTPKTTASLTIRQAPTTHDKSVGSIGKGKTAEVWCRVTSQSVSGNKSWYAVGTGGGGWVSAKYVKTTKTVPYCSQES